MSTQVQEQGRETDTQAERPWETMVPGIKLDGIQLTAETYGVPSRAMFDWFDLYVAKFSQGPDVFIPWYKQQRRRWELGLLRFEPYYPHELYPQLVEAGADWLYDHPAWKRP